MFGLMELPRMRDVDPAVRAVYDAVRRACSTDVSGGQIMAAVQEAIADSRQEPEPAAEQ